MRQVLIIKGCFFALLLVFVLALVSSASEKAPVVKALTMETQGNTVKFIIDKTGAIDYQDFKLKNPDRLIVDLVGAKHELSQSNYKGDGRFVNQVRTSQFMSSPDEITRLVFDLNKEKSFHKIKEDANKVIIEFTPEADLTSSRENAVMNASMSSSMPGLDSGGSQETVADKQTQPLAVKGGVPANVPQPQAQMNAAQQKASASQPVSQPLNVASSWPGSQPSRLAAPAFPQDTEMQASSMASARNNKITIDVQNADIKTVLQSFSEFSGVNIISGPEVTGDVTAHLKGVPWKQALQIVLKTNGFGYSEEYGVIRVSTIEMLTKEELAKEAADRKKDDLLPLVTKIVPLAYANADEMQKALKKMVSQRGNIEVEKGSNALIVTDIQKNVDKIASMAMELDKKVKQVEIVAKLVDVDVGASTDMGIRWDFLNLAPASGGVIGDATVDASTAAPLGRFRVGTVRSWGELRVALDMLEQANKANIISNPRIVTADNREASILVGKQIPLIVSDEAGNPITELTKVGIGLRVTPHVNSDNTITLDLHPQVSELSAQATVQGGVIISLSEADTRVMVSDGETAVIGGLMSQVESTLERGLPVLKDVPVVGNLFKYKNKTKSKRELIIFITPRVVAKLASN